MPTWWIPGRHDYVLLLTVKKYGLGPEWQQVKIFLFFPFFFLILFFS